MSVDLWADQVSCLLHMDGTHGGTTFTDEKGKTVTTGGSVTLTTSTYKYGTASGDFPGGNSDVLSMAAHDDFNFGSGNLTLEAWFKENNVSRVNMNLLEKDSGAFPVGSWSLQINTAGANGKWSFSLRDFSGVAYMLEQGSATDYGDNAWHHVAVTRNGNWWHLWVDGVLEDVELYAGAVTDLSTAVYIGNSVNASRGWTGQIDDVRITKGHARYTTAFTVPAAAFSNTPDDGTTTGTTGAQGAPGVSIFGPPGEDGAGLARTLSLPTPPKSYDPSDHARARHLIERAFRG